MRLLLQDAKCCWYSMIIWPIADALHSAGLVPPTLNALTADANNYTVSLFQPTGVIEATEAGIQNRDRGLATAQFGKFLADAAASQPDLVVTPEYSVPWDVLKNAISGTSAGPTDGKLWALGCESIRYSELQQWKLGLANIAEVLFETMPPDDSKFVDPLAYVFRAPTSTSSATRKKLVVLVQFKTHPMVDLHDFEQNHLQTGQRIYRLGTAGAGISLVTFICSDMLALDDSLAQDVHDRALILHIQLNGKRQHPQLIAFRQHLLDLSGDCTELLALNWARGTKVFEGEHDAEIGKCAGSVWYLKVDKIALDDAVVTSNHRHGLYYTRLEPRRTHALFFNFSEATFRLKASKVVRIGVPGAAGNRRGPHLDVAKTWDLEQGDWVESGSLGDDFAAMLPDCGHASASIKAAYDVCPIACERLLSLCGGMNIAGNDWYSVRKLRSFNLSLDELISRLTFCQSTCESSVRFRREHMRRCSHLWNALSNVANLPAFLKDAAPGFELDWSGDRPHQNLKGVEGEHATVIYLGESSLAAAQGVHASIRKLLDQTLPEDEDGQENAPHSSYRAKQRVAVWFMDEFGQRRQYIRTPSIVGTEEDPADIRRIS